MSTSVQAIRLPLILVLASLAAGCPSVERTPTQASIVELEADHSDRNYLLYVPSTYHDTRTWPLVVLCHGTWPYDTADLQMQEWANYAEQKGFIVVAPSLEATRADLPLSPERQVALQQSDESAI